MSGPCFHFLYIDDDQSDAFFFARALSKCPREVITHWASSGQLAIAHLTDDSKPKPNLIICDVKMPAMSGFEFLKWLRASPFRRTPLVILSGSVLAVDVNLAFDLGANAYVAKPGSPEEFAKALAAIVEFWCGVCVLPSQDENTPFATTGAEFVHSDLMAHS